MTESTLNYAKHIIKIHRQHTEYAMNHGSKQAAKVQEAYFQGLLTMLEIIVTEGYTVPMPENFWGRGGASE